MLIDKFFEDAIDTEAWISKPWTSKPKKKEEESDQYSTPAAGEHDSSIGSILAIICVVFALLAAVYLLNLV